MYRLTPRLLPIHLISFTFLIFSVQCGKDVFVSVSDLNIPGQNSGDPFSGEGNPFAEGGNPSLPQLEAPGSLPEGLRGGHFDLDTSSQIYAPNDGETDKHIHEYDDKHEVNGADFFKLLDRNLGEIDEHIADNQPFILIVANAQLSTGAVLEINGRRAKAIDYQKSGVRPVFSIGAASGAAQLTSLKLSFAPTAIETGGLVPTETGCVVSNRPGFNGEYRNGALVLQALDANDYSINPATGTASSGLLWEATLFWHLKDSCQK